MSGGESWCSSLSKIRCVVSFVFQKKPSFHSSLFYRCFLVILFVCSGFLIRHFGFHPCFLLRLRKRHFWHQKNAGNPGFPRLYQLPGGWQAILRPHGATTAGGRWPSLLGVERKESAGRPATTRNQLDHESVGISLFRVLLVRDDILPYYVWIISEIITRIHIYQPIFNGKYEV